MFKFGSIGRKAGANLASSGAADGQGVGSASGAPKMPFADAEAGPNAHGSEPTGAGVTSMGLPSIPGATIALDPHSLSNDSYSSEGGGSSSRGASSNSANGLSGSIGELKAAKSQPMQPSAPIGSSPSARPQREASKVQQQQQSRIPSGPARLQPAAEVNTPNGASPSLAVPEGPSSGGGFASRLLRRVSSAPDANKLFANGLLGRNGPPSPSAPRNGFLSPDAAGQSGHQQYSSETAATPPTPGASDNSSAFFPGSPVRMDSTATSFSSKDFEKGRSPSCKGSSTPKSKGGIAFPGSGRSKSGGSRTAAGDKKLPMLHPPSSAHNLAALQNSHGSNGPTSPGRGNFRRTYSSNSIKIRDVEVGPNSFSKIKMLGKGDVGKVYLVREKKTEKLFAMKGG